jgi:hypothetical protein
MEDDETTEVQLKAARENDMTKCERIKALIAGSAGLFTDADLKFLGEASDEQLARFEAQAKQHTDLKAAADKTAADLKAASDKTAADLKAAADEKAKQEADDKAAADLKAAREKAIQDATPKTAAEYIAAAPAGVREILQASLKAAEDRKTATIKSLVESKRCPFAEAKLQTLSQEDLDGLVKMAEVKVAASTVDFSGQGAPRTESDTAIAAPPSLRDALAANQKK